MVSILIIIGLVGLLIGVMTLTKKTASLGQDKAEFWGGLGDIAAKAIHEILKEQKDNLLKNFSPPLQKGLGAVTDGLIKGINPEKLYLADCKKIIDKARSTVLVAANHAAQGNHRLLVEKCQNLIQNIQLLEQAVAEKAISYPELESKINDIMDIAETIRQYCLDQNTASGKKDYYDILEIQANATQEEIKKAWLRLIKAWHPDKYSATDPDKIHAENKTRLINEAYQTLSDLQKRADYDKKRCQI